MSLGHEHGLASLMPGAAIALPLVDGRVVSSRDVQRHAIALPCVLGLRRKHTRGAKHTLALPPSASASWGGRVRWELAIVQAFGATFPSRTPSARHLSSGRSSSRRSPRRAVMATRAASRRWRRSCASMRRAWAGCYPG